MTAPQHPTSSTSTGRLSESLEDYLEAILHVEDEKHAARAKEIADRLEVSPPSVTAALQNLSTRGLVNYRPYDLITLTASGRRMARDVDRRHKGLRRFFVDLLCIKVSEADEIACGMEHSLPPHVLHRLVEFIDFIAESPHGGVTWSDEAGFELRFADGPPDATEAVDEAATTVDPTHPSS